MLFEFGSLIFYLCLKQNLLLILSNSTLLLPLPVPPKLVPLPPVLVPLLPPKLDPLPPKFTPDPKMEPLPPKLEPLFPNPNPPELLPGLKYFYKVNISKYLFGGP